MAMSWCRAVLIGAFILAATIPVSQIRAGDAAELSWNPEAAAKYLDARAKWWLDWPSGARGQGTACISCHTTFPFAIARPTLGAHLGEKEEGAIEKSVIDNLKKRVANWDNIVAESNDKNPFRPFYGNQRKPSSLGTESVLNALVLVNNDVRRAKGVLSAPTKKALGHLWEQQQKDGAWLWLDFGLRPWETEAPYYGAALAALAVGMAGKDYCDQADVEPKVAALKKYLRAQYPSQPLHHRMVALWAASKLPGILTRKSQRNSLRSF